MASFMKYYNYIVDLFGPWYKHGSIISLFTVMAGTHSPGFNPHLPGFKYNFLAKGLGATMWFFIFYRARQDGGKLLGKHPWDSHGHDTNGHH